MSRPGAELRSINCTQCAAPLSLHGGHRVESITCGYCGSVLDTREEFKVIKTYANLTRPWAPLAIGMSGKLKGVEFTVIGMVQLRDDWGGVWVEFAIYSPTHGYAWLEYERGHFVFSRRVRDVPETPIVNRVKSHFDASGHRFEVFSRYQATVSFVEGELPYIDEIGRRVSLLDAIAPPFIYTVERSTEGEEEYVLGEYLDPAEVYAAFAVDGEPRKRDSVHPAQPYRPSPVVSGLSAAGVIFTPIALVLLLYTVLFGSGNVLLDRDMRPQTLQNNIASSESTIEVKNAGSLTRLDVRIPRQKGWGSFDVSVQRDNEVVYSLDRHLAASGASPGDRTYWALPSSTAQAWLRLPKDGSYVVKVAVKAGKQQSASGPLQITIREGILLSRYYFILLILALVALALSPLAKMRFEAARWADEDDDDDD